MRGLCPRPSMNGWPRSVVLPPLRTHNAAGLICTSFARTLLPERAAGLLRVRRAPADVVVMTALGVVLVVLSVLVPDQPRGL